MKIGIDLDDVVFEFVKHLIDNYNEEFNKEISYEDFVTYHFADVWHLNKQETSDFFEKLLTKELVTNQALCVFTKKSFFVLSKNHEIYFITSRIFRDGTLESLNKHCLDINFKLIFSSNPYVETEGKTKGAICNELGLTL